MFCSVFRRFKPTTPLRRYGNLTWMFCVPKTTANTKLQLGLFFVPRYLSQTAVLNFHKICGLWHCSHPPNYPNLPILFVSPIAFSKKSRYICGGESQRSTLPLKGSPLSNLLKIVSVDGLTPLSDGHRESQGFHHSTGSGVSLLCLCCNCNIHLLHFQEITLYLLYDKVVMSKYRFIT